MKTLLINITAENMKCLSTFNSMYTDTNYTNLFSIRSKAFCYHNQKKKKTRKSCITLFSLYFTSKLWYRGESVWRTVPEKVCVTLNTFVFSFVYTRRNLLSLQHLEYNI